MTDEGLSRGTLLAELAVLVGVVVAGYGVVADLPAVVVAGSVFVSAGLIAGLLLNVDRFVDEDPDEHTPDGGETQGATEEDPG